MTHSITELPRFDDSPANWRGPELLAEPQRWTHPLTAAERDDLHSIIERYGTERTALTDLTRSDVPLPHLGPAIDRLREALLEGIGFGLIRGFPIDQYSLRQAATAFWAIGLHLGEPLSQNAAGHALGHVRDLGFDYLQPSARGYQTAERLPYHCDAGDVVGLLCVRTARTGGLSSAVSSTALYHAMVDRYPEFAEVLMQSTWRDRRDEIPPGREAWYEMPVFNIHQGRVYGHYVRSAINKSQRHASVPRLTPKQLKAFDKLDELAADPEFRLDMKFEPGDMQFVCNHWILHSRTRFEDWAEPERRRHLLRLWLGCPDGPPVPPVYEAQQGLTDLGRPAGIRCSSDPLETPLEALDGGAGDSSLRRKET